MTYLRMLLVLKIRSLGCNFFVFLFLKIFPLDNIVSSEEISLVSSEVKRLEIRDQGDK